MNTLDKAIRICDASQMFGVYYKNGNLLGFVSAPYDDWKQAKRNAFDKFGEYLNESSGAFIKRLDSEGKTMRIN